MIEDFDQPGLEATEDSVTPTNPLPPKQGPDAEPSTLKKTFSGKREKSHPETKKKKFRYGTKNERQADRKKAQSKKQKRRGKRE